MQVKDEQSHFLQYIVYAFAAIGVYVVYRLLFGRSYFEVPHKYVKESASFHGSYRRGEKHWVTNPNESVKISLAKQGVANLKPVTVFTVVEQAVKGDPNADYLKKEYLNQNGEYEWKTIKRKEFYDQVKQASRGFIKLGLQPWESIVIMGFNSPEWFIADLAAIYAGGLASGIYTTNESGQCKYIANHCKARVVVLEDNKQLKKFVSIADELIHVKALVIWGEQPDSKLKEQSKIQILTWSEFLKLGDSDDKDTLESEGSKRREKIQPGNCCTLIYTSGTTGPPKAVMISHDNITWNVQSILSSMKECKWNCRHSVISYLPLSHIAAQFIDIHAPLGIFAHYKGTGCVYFARPDALKGSLLKTLVYARPTIFFGVPRVWEKMEESMKEIAKKSPKILTLISSWAKSIGLQANRNLEIGGNRKIPFGYSLANTLVFSKIRQRLGLDQCMLCVSGAAPIKKPTLEYFSSLGIRIVEVYGMSESTGVHTVGRTYHNRIGGVGSPIDGVELIIDHNPSRDKKGEGEICMRGRLVMMGYMYDEDKTKQTIDDEGLLHSGDVGRVDEDGILHITGRIKELIITAGGENVAPVPIEDYIKEQCPGISNVVIVGDHRKFLTALITLKCKQDLDTGLFSDELVSAAKDVSSKSKTVKEAKQDPAWKEYIDKAINKYNKDSNHCVSNAQTIKYYSILDTDFSEKNGELTSTLKLKRSVINEKYHNIIETMYQSKD